MIYIGLNPREIVPFEEILKLENQPWQRIYKNEVRKILSEGFVSCFNQNHHLVLKRINKRCDLNITLPDVPSRHRLHIGDKVILVLIANIHGIKYEGEKYTEEDLRKSRINFRLYNIRY